MSAFNPIEWLAEMGIPEVPTLEPLSKEEWVKQLAQVQSAAELDALTLRLPSNTSFTERMQMYRRLTSSIPNGKTTDS